MIAWNSFLDYFVMSGENVKISVLAILSLAMIFRRSAIVGQYYKRFSSLPTNLILISILALALGVRLAWILWSPHTPPSAITEEHVMLRHARDLVAGRGYVTTEGEWDSARPIGYAIWLALLFKLFGENMWVVELFQVAFGVCTIFLVYRIGRQVFGKEVGLISAFLLAIYPTSIFASKIVLEEHIFVPCWLLGLSFFISDFQRSSWKKVIVAGILFGGAALLRPYTAAMGSVVLFLWVIFKRKAWQGILRLTVIQIIILVWALPWGIRNYIKLGKFIPYTSWTGHILYYTNNPTSDVRYPVNPTAEQGGDPDFLYATDVLERSRAGERAAFRWIRENPVTFIEKAIGKVIYMLGINREGWIVLDNFYTVREGRSPPSYRFVRRLDKCDNDYYGNIFLLALCGMIYFALNRKSSEKLRSGWAILLTIFYYLCIIGLTLNHRKYRFPLEPLFCVFAAYWILTIWFGRAVKTEARGVS